MTPACKSDGGTVREPAAAPEQEAVGHPMRGASRGENGRATETGGDVR